MVKKYSPKLPVIKDLWVRLIDAEKKKILPVDTDFDLITKEVNAFQT